MRKIFIAALCLISSNLFAQITVPKSVEILGDLRIEQYTTLNKTLTEIQRDAEENKPSFASPKEYIQYINEKWYADAKFDQTALVDFYENYQNTQEYYTAALDNANISDELKVWIRELNAKFDAVASEEEFENAMVEFATNVNTLDVTSSDRVVGESMVLMINGLYQVAREAYIRNHPEEGSVAFSTGINTTPVSAMQQSFSLVMDDSYQAAKAGYQVNSVNFHFRGFWAGFWKGVKCAVGTLGMAGGGAVAGAAVGTVTLPVVGTVSGTALGLYSGAAAGIASFCL